MSGTDAAGAYVLLPPASRSPPQLLTIKIMFMGRKWLRNIVKGVSLTSALFVFQACYGTPQDLGFDFWIEGQVKSKTTGLPIRGIKVSVADGVQYEYTDENGRFGFFTEKVEGVKLQFQDVDSTENRWYQHRDTLLSVAKEQVFLNIELEEKK